MCVCFSSGRCFKCDKIGKCQPNTCVESLDFSRLSVCGFCFIPVTHVVSIYGLIDNNILSPEEHNKICVGRLPQARSRWRCSVLAALSKLCMAPFSFFSLIQANQNELINNLSFFSMMFEGTRSLSSQHRLFDHVCFARKYFANRFCVFFLALPRAVVPPSNNLLSSMIAADSTSSSFSLLVVFFHFSLLFFSFVHTWFVFLLISCSLEASSSYQHVKYIQPVQIEKSKNFDSPHFQNSTLFMTMFLFSQMPSQSDCPIRLFRWSSLVHFSSRLVF